MAWFPPADWGWGCEEESAAGAGPSTREPTQKGRNWSYESTSETMAYSSAGVYLSRQADGERRGDQRGFLGQKPLCRSEESVPSLTSICTHGSCFRSLYCVAPPLPPPAAALPATFARSFREKNVRLWQADTDIRAGSRGKEAPSDCEASYRGRGPARTEAAPLWLCVSLRAGAARALQRGAHRAGLESMLKFGGCERGEMGM